MFLSGDESETKSSPSQYISLSELNNEYDETVVFKEYVGFSVVMLSDIGKPYSTVLVDTVDLRLSVKD